MNEKNKDSTNEILSETEIIRINKQYQILKDWRDGKITGLECIEQVLNLQKIIYFKKTKS